MNLISQIKPFIPEQKRKFYPKILLILLCITVVSISSWVYIRRNHVKAYPFGLNNDYAEMIEMNKRLLNLVPIPVSAIGTNYETGDKRIVALLIFLQQYMSPAASLNVAKTFVESADANGFGDRWQLLPAIAGVESGFCRLIPYSYGKSSHNCWGWGGPGNWFYFNSWEDAIINISSGLAKGYGVENLVPEIMVRSYCPPCYENGGYWANGVHQYINEINEIYKSL